MDKYFSSQAKPNTNIMLYFPYPPHFKFELPMNPGKGEIVAEEQNTSFWLVHTTKYFPTLPGAVRDLFTLEKTTQEAPAFLCMSYTDLPIGFFAHRSAPQAPLAFYDSSEIRKLVDGLHKYHPTASTSGDVIRTLTPPRTVKIFASAPISYSSDYVVKILLQSMQVYTPGTTATVLRKSCAGTLKVLNVLGPITVKILNFQ
ncbi:conserved hypothetical protein [Trichinella spiralis]|uniref:hypothetical protein n=1 Tax=Trichinella spiralis TaxID=6334 RepID=UPI0001EFCCB4|nr:conserved hypothetical protein [Trichinella spiralis]